MKRILVLTLLLVCSPTYALVEFCNSATCIDFGEEQVQSIETTTEPTYGINIRLKGGYVKFFEANTRPDAVLMLHEGYESLQEYYNWSDDYYYRILRQQDKAQLGRY